MSALADKGVRQHGFCEWMKGLDAPWSIQSHRWKYFIAADITSVSSYSKLTDLFIEKSTFHYVMDKGFYSEPNIDAFYADHFQKQIFELYRLTV